MLRRNLYWLPGLSCALLLGLLAGAGAARILVLRAEPRAAPITSTSAETPSRPLPLRLVDAGAVGIEPDTAAWGTSYSHGTRAFHHVLRTDPPWVDDDAFARVRTDWRTYVDRMAGYGNNGIIFPAFLELIDFTGVGDGHAVYRGSDVFPFRHRVLRNRYGELFADARRAGMGVWLKTDMIALTEPLERYLLRSLGRIDAADARLWDVFAAGLDELFTSMPDVRGVVIRVGEAGSLYNREGWEYRSEMIVREPEHLRTMLRTLLPTFERHGRSLILRSWTVGVGALGQLHTDPELYESVLGDVDSPSLIVSTKYTQGDYYGYLPVNPTLLAGRHRRMVEFQARREYEAFGAVPNYLAREHQTALQTVLAHNPNIVGVSLWTQEGGPLFAGPMSLYPLHGFWRWIDANVYATSRLALDPHTDVQALTRDWVRLTVSDEPAVVDALARLLLSSRTALERGLYIRPFAERRVLLGGLEAPPLLWVMEWDFVGGWNAVLSLVYRVTRGEADTAVRDGFDAVRRVQEMRRLLDSIAPRLAHDPYLAHMQRSLDYEESLFTALAWYRRTFLGHYRWLDTGDAGAHAGFLASRDRFYALAAQHHAAFAGDLDFPAFEFGSAVAGVGRAETGLIARRAARGLLLGMALLLLAGLLGPRCSVRSRADRFARVVWTGVIAPWRLDRALPHPNGPLWVLAVLVLAACALTASLFLSFASSAIVLAVVALLIAFALALKGAWHGAALSARDAYAPATLAPLLILAVLVLSFVAVRGPDLFWLRFWTDSVFRGVVAGLTTSLLVWTLLATIAAGRSLAGASLTRALGSLLVATGCALIVLATMMPDLEHILASLDDPLIILPMKMALITGVTTYAGVPEAIMWYPGVLGGILTAGGLVLRRVRSDGTPSLDPRRRSSAPARDTRVS